MQILRQFSNERREIGVGELSQAVGAAKSTVSRIARTLESEGFLERNPETARYRLGLRLWELGCLAIDQGHGFPECARPHLEALVERTHESAHAVILDGFETLYVDKVDAQRSIRTYTSLGARFPAYCTASGRALLAFEPEARIEQIARRRLRRYTARTIVDGDRLRAALRKVRASGYAINRGEWRDDIGGIAAPVRDRGGAVVGALGVTLPLTRFPRRADAPVVRGVVEAARRLSAELGYIARN